MPALTRSPACGSEFSVVFRVDESAQIGRGHMSRCMALASALAAQGARISFHCLAIRSLTRAALQAQGIDVVEWPDEQSFLAQDLRASIVVVDGYQFQEGFWQALDQAKPRRTVAIDDLRPIRHIADLVVCYNEGVKPSQFKLDPRSRLLLGGRYLLLRPEIRTAGLRAQTPCPRRALMLASGGTHQESWVAQTLRQLAALEPSAPLWVLSGKRLAARKVLAQAGLATSQVRFFSGLGARAMMRLYHRSRALLTPGSTLMLEAFAAGVPILTGWIADNQRNSLDFFEQQGLVMNLGDLHHIQPRQLRHAHQQARRHAHEMIRRQRAYIRASQAGLDELVQAVLASSPARPPCHTVPTFSE